MTLKPPDQTFVRNDAELHELWCDLMGHGGFAQRSLWLIFFEDAGRLSPVVVPIDDLPDEPDAQAVDNLTMIVRNTIEPPVRSVAMLLSRPGPDTMLAGDRRWARMLREAFGPELAPWPIHLATTGLVRVFAPDDLVA